MNKLLHSSLDRLLTSVATSDLSSSPARPAISHCGASSATLKDKEGSVLHKSLSAWYTAGARKRIIGSSDMYASEECKVVHHPNKMVYTNDEGERREIYMPTRDFYKAMAHIRKEEWDELAKFPRWENQRYTEADNLKNITDLTAFYSVPPPEYDDTAQAEDASKEHEHDTSEKK
ncbi:uncharacterized protein LMH87_007775 [Akanthomyces muscarius]|uniref:Uncharacterized protein n=1 Tax=Akanthomyces muscarius TaxID=2231603 RepID=A0A9W8QLD9_AKAMU|nr:uncharacterized protein LMH87_007775 [Akanthomyces muscarius]KAJ4159836.1 hypothetical protein LMH87_007775 [Akanthomyces muscarius]